MTCLTSDSEIPPSYPPSLWTVLLPVRHHLPRSWFRLVFVFSVIRLVSRRCHAILTLPCPFPTYGTMRVLTPAQDHLPGQVSPLISHTLPDIPPPNTRMTRTSFTIANPNVSGDFQASPSLRGLAVITPPNRVRYPADCQFAYGCSPPRLTATQLPSATGFMACPDTDSHRTMCTPSRAHGVRRLVAAGRKRRRRVAALHTIRATAYTVA